MAYAPPKALLVLLRQQLQPQVAEVDGSQLAAALWCFSLFRDVSAELWNAAMSVLSQPHITAMLQPVALAQLYQVCQSQLVHHIHDDALHQHCNDDLLNQNTGCVHLSNRLNSHSCGCFRLCNVIRHIYC